MRRTNINAVLNMVQEFLDGEMDSISFQLDFPYEIEQRYRKMVREDSDFADMIYCYLVEQGVDLAGEMSDTDFKKLIQRQYDNVLDGVY
jgi:hypothetical protein